MCLSDTHGNHHAIRHKIPGVFVRRLGGVQLVVMTETMELGGSRVCATRKEVERRLVKFQKAWELTDQVVKAVKC